MNELNDSESILERFEEFLRGKRLASNTLQSYRRDIKQFEDYLNNLNLSIISDDYHNQVQMFLSYLQRNGMSSSTIWRKFAAIKRFYQYISYSTNAVSYRPMQDIELPKIEKKLPALLPSQTMELLLEQPSCNTAKGYRDKAMLELLFATGIRVSELICLNVDDVDTVNGCIRCIGRHKNRSIPVESSAMETLTGYLQECRSSLLHSPNEPALFTNRKNGKRLTRQGFWKIIKYYQHKAKLGTAITPHMVRHYVGTLLFEKGLDLGELQKLLGHADGSFTRMYARMSANGSKK